MRKRAASDLAVIKSSISGWSQRIVAIIAPRREPADIIVRHIASQTSINDNGPDASAATPLTSAPLGRIVLKSYPMPPPCCIVSAASLSMSKMPPILSGIVPITKQLNIVTLRAVPAPAVIRPAGRNLKSSRASKNLPSQALGSFSTDARSLAIRRQESSTVTSFGVPSASLKRYFISQICSAMGAVKRVIT